MRLGRAAWVVVVVLAIAVPCTAADRWVNQVRTHVFASRVEKAVALLEGEMLAGLDGEPALLATIGLTLDVYGSFMSQQDPEQAARFFDPLAALAERMRQAAPEDGATRTAWALIVSARCRHRLMGGHAKPQPAWIEAAEIVHALGTREDETRAARWLAEAAAAKGADADALLARSKAWLEKALETEQSEPARAAALARGHAQRARAWLARKARSAAKAEVEGGLQLLEPHLDGGDDEVQDAHTDLVALNEAGRLRVRSAEFRTQPATSSDKRIVVDVPRSRLWQVPSPERNQILRLDQRDARDLPRRLILLYAYDLKTKLSGPSGRSVAVANAKSHASGMFDALPEKLQVGEIVERRKPKKARLHKSLGAAYVSELVGRTHDDRWARVRVYYFNPKAAKRAYVLTVRHYVNEPDTDGAAAFVLSNLRAREK